MEWKGYADGYDKNAVYKQDHSIEELDTLEKRYAEKKKRLKVNIIEFVVGVVLLVFCWQYLQNHPAEKVALFTGFEVISEKVMMLFASNSEEIQEKNQLERSFQAVISLAKEGDCLATKTIQELEQRSLALERLDIDMFASQKSAFARYLSSIYVQIKNECDIE